MLPERLLRWAVSGDRLITRYLEPDDEAWLGAMLEIVRARASLPRRDIEALLRHALPSPCSRDGVRLALHVALELCAAPAPPSPSPRRARWEAFKERARSDSSRDEVIATVARQLGITSSELERCLLADIPSERAIGTIEDGLTAAELRLRVNLQLAQGLAARADRLTIDIEGHARRVVQHATWQGLLCTVLGDDPARCRLDVSGPLTALHPTRLYARALSSMVPVLHGCRRFRLEAACRLDGRELTFRLDETDPVARSVDVVRHDSLIEEAFESDLLRLAPDWDVLREPSALPVAGTLVFPDFAIGPRAEPSSRVLVEIVGWWTRDYIETKLARLREAQCTRLIICLEQRTPASADDVAGLDVIPFRRRVDARRVLERARELLAR